MTERTDAVPRSDVRADVSAVLRASPGRASLDRPPDLDAVFTHAVVELEGRFGHRFTRETIRRVIEEQYQELARTATITHHLPIFAVRRARRMLATMTVEGGAHRF